MAMEEYKRFQHCMTRRDYGEALRIAEMELLEAGDSNVFWLTQSSRAQRALGQADAARMNAERALMHAPRNAYALLARADALCALERFEEARADYLEIEGDERVGHLARRGILNCLASLKDWPGVLRNLAIGKVSGAAAHHWRLTALKELGRCDEAMAEARQWLDESPDHPRALWALTELEVEREGLDHVARRFARLARIPSRPSIYGEIYASLCKRLGKPEVAAAQYDKMTRSTVATPGLQRKQAFALAKGGREVEAIPLMEQFLLDDPGDMYMHSAYIAACRRIDELGRCRDFYDTLRDARPEEKRVFGYIKRVERYLDQARRTD